MQGSNAPTQNEILPSSDGLKRQIGFFGLTMIAAGGCIGSGIFITPSAIAAELGHPNAVLLVWLIGGVITITGSLTFAELAGRFPLAGGVYVYIRESFGKIWGFLYGWCILTVITSGAIAGLSLTFTRYLSTLVTLSQTGQLIIAITAIIVAMLVNILGVKPGAIFSSVFTIFKLIGLAGILIAGIFVGHHISDNASIEATTSSSPAIGAFALAMIGVLWSYGGWHHASYISAETKSAQRVVPRAMIAGALIVTTTYVLANWAYLRLLPIDAIAQSTAVASDALKTVLPAGAILVALLITVSTFGSIGIYTLTAPRIYYSMGRDGSFFKAFARVNANGTPIWAIVIQSSWSIVVLLFWATFDDLITYVVFMDWIFMTMAAISLFYFRKNLLKGNTGGFKTPLYPIVPLIFIGFSLWFIIYTLIGKPEQALAGLVLLAIGLPVYYFSRGR